MKAKEKEIIKNYKSTIDRIKELDETKKNLRKELNPLFVKYGEKYKEGTESSFIEFENVSIYNIEKVKEEVNTKRASEVLKSKGFSDAIDIKAELTLKDGVCSSDVPKELLESLSTYFNVSIEQEIPKERLLFLRDNKELTNSDFDKCIDKKISYAVIVKENDEER